MKLVNAGIKSKRELAERLMAGEEFFTLGGALISYEENASGSPFRFRVKDGLHDVWNSYESLQKEASWYENIEKPILCWASDYKGQNNKLQGKLYLISTYTGESSYPFSGTDETIWKYATPVTQEEVDQWDIS